MSGTIETIVVYLLLQQFVIVTIIHRTYLNRASHPSDPIQIKVDVLKLFVIVVFGGDHKNKVTVSSHQLDHL